MGEDYGRGIWERNLGEEFARGIWDSSMGEESGRGIWGRKLGEEYGRGIWERNLREDRQWLGCHHMCLCRWRRRRSSDLSERGFLVDIGSMFFLSIRQHFIVSNTNWCHICSQAPVTSKILYHPYVISNFTRHSHTTGRHTLGFLSTLRQRTTSSASVSPRAL